MIQRKQTLYLLAAFFLTAACLCLSVGEIEPAGMGVNAVVYNLWTMRGGEVVSFSNCPLFVFLVLSAPVALITVFLYKNRKLQARLCTLNVVLMLAWYVYFAFCWLNVFQTEGQAFHIRIAACFPFLSLVFYVLAHKGIMDDERLIRAADRIR